MKRQTFEIDGHIRWAVAYKPTDPDKRDATTGHSVLLRQCRAPLGRLPLPHDREAARHALPPVSVSRWRLLASPLAPERPLWYQTPIQSLDTGPRRGLNLRGRVVYFRHRSHRGRRRPSGTAVRRISEAGSLTRTVLAPTIKPSIEVARVIDNSARSSFYKPRASPGNPHLFDSRSRKPQIFSSASSAQPPRQ
jgi:hypothetical protein